MIPELTEASFIGLKEEGVIADGMLPKLENAFRALRQGAKKAVILNAASIAKGKGTEISL